MLIESIIKRPNGTQAGIGGVTYDFQPDTAGRHVCNVDDEEHVARFLSITEGYRYAKPLLTAAAPKAATPAPQAPAASTTAPVKDAGSNDGDAEPAGDGKPTPAGGSASDPVFDGKRLSEMTREELEDVYTKKTGKKAHPRIKIENLRNLIADED